MALPFRKSDAKAQTPQARTSPGPGPVPPPGKAEALDPDTRKAVQEEAYRLWQQDGCKHGNDQRYWFEALKRVKARGK